jgi:serine-type D-Ala-D-Ala carboxypeptidase (penicillin-binding protein 5/6)
VPQDHRSSRWRRSLLSAACALFLLYGLLAPSGLSIASPAAAAADDESIPSIELTAEAGIVVDTATGQILAAKNDREQLPEASTTKVMTALLVLEHAKLDDIVTVQPDDLVGESNMGLVAGERINVETLLYGLLLPSGNDAAMALARHVGDSLPSAPGKDGVAKFVDLMNARAAEMGLVDTHFMDPHGLDDPNHYTTARDLATITWYACRQPKFMQIVSTHYYEGYGHELYQTNQLLDTYPGADGVKTGLTDNAGACLVFSATRDGHRLIGVVLNAPRLWDDASALLDYGFGALDSQSSASNQTSGGTGPLRSQQDLALLIGSIGNPTLPITELYDRYTAATSGHIGIPRGDELISPNLLQSLAGAVRRSILESQPQTAGANTPTAQDQPQPEVTQPSEPVTSAPGASGPSYLWIVAALVIVAVIGSGAAWWWLRRAKETGPHRGLYSIDSQLSEAEAEPDEVEIEASQTEESLDDLALRAVDLAAEGDYVAATLKFARVILVDRIFDFGSVEGFDSLSVRGFVALAEAYNACDCPEYAEALLRWVELRFPGEAASLVSDRI